MSVEQTLVQIVKNEDDSINYVDTTFVVKQGEEPDIRQSISSIRLPGEFFEGSEISPNEFGNTLEDILQQFVHNFGLEIPA